MVTEQVHYCLRLIFFKFCDPLLHVLILRIAIFWPSLCYCAVLNQQETSFLSGFYGFILDSIAVRTFFLSGFYRLPFAETSMLVSMMQIGFI